MISRYQYSTFFWLWGIIFQGKTITFANQPYKVTVPPLGGRDRHMRLKGRILYLMLILAPVDIPDQTKPFGTIREKSRYLDSTGHGIICFLVIWRKLPHGYGFHGTACPATTWG